MEAVVKENRSPRTRIALAYQEEACRSQVFIREFDAFIVDEPLTAGGSDKGPTPLECMCAALASCQVVTIEKIAQSLDFHCSDIKAVANADINFVAARADMSAVPRFVAVRVDLDIVSSEPNARRSDLMSRVEARCPVSALFRDASISLTFDWKWRASLHAESPVETHRR